MQFTTPIQQLTTCPQCDNVVRIDAEFCNICGKRLRPPSTPGQLSPAQQEEVEGEEEEYDDDEEYFDDDEEQEAHGTVSTAHHTGQPSTASLSTGEIVSLLHHLQEQSGQMERYFPADLSDKERRLATWQKQIARALACVELCDCPQLQHIESPQPLKLRHHIAEAARALDFTHENSSGSDMQTFLTVSRYEVQLRQAETQLALALQQLEDFCWEQLNQEGIQSRDLEELQQEMTARQSKRSAMRFQQLQARTGHMRAAWREALKAFDTMMLTNNNAYHQALLAAHDRTARRIKIRILQGYFDHCIKVGTSGLPDSPALEIGNRWVDIDGWNLIKELRIGLTAALEREMQEPARTLAEAFLIPIAHREEIDGSLDIHAIAFGEAGGELDEIQKAYAKLKRAIRDKARDVCLYVTLGELLNEEKYAPTKDDPAVGALYRLAATSGKPEDILLQGRQLMGPILDVICGRLAQSTEQRIARLFRYELDKLEERLIFESDRLDSPAGTQPGTFTELVNHLYSLLAERLLTSQTLRDQLDALQARREANIKCLIELLREVEELKTMHRQI